MLINAGLTDHPTAGAQKLRGVGQNTAQVGEAFFGSDERGLRIKLTDFRIGLGHFSFGEIRRVRDDQIVGAGNGGEPIRLSEVDALRQVALRGVLAGQRERVG